MTKEGPVEVLIVGSDEAPVLADGVFRVRQVTTGVEAFGRLTAARVDVVLARQRVTDVDSRRLLERVKDDWPTIVRIRESDRDEPRLHADVDPAHRVITPEFDGHELEHALLQAAELRGRLDGGLLTSLVQHFDGLPSAPTTWTEMTRLLSHPQTASVQALAATVEHDVALTAQVLRQANSALLARGKRVSTVQDAIVRLGFQTLQQLVLHAETGRMFARATAGGVDVEALSEEGLQRGVLAASMVSDRAERSEAFVAAMLLDVGQLVSACFLPDETRRLRAIARSRGWTLQSAEAVAWGVTHADLGAHLLEEWNLPVSAVSAVALHHEPPAPRGWVDASTAARVSRYARGTDDPLDGLEDLAGWDAVVPAVAVPSAPTPR